MRIFSLLPIAVVAVALTTGTAVAQQRPSGNVTDANGPITILKNMVAEPNGLVVRINSREVDDLRRAAYADITSVAHAGSNTLTVTWSRPVQRLDFKIAYAPTRNNFKNVLVIKIDANQKEALRHPGSQTFVFTIPH